MIIAVDGPAGSGKSSVSREAARRLGIKYIDSGALYRTVTWFLLEKYGGLTRGKSYAEDCDGLSITQVFNPDGTLTTYANGADVSNKIRDEVIAKNIGIVSDDPLIREYVNALLRRWSMRDSIIMDGRDLGTVVFPDADVKIFLDASVEIRSLRRSLEYEEKGKTVDVNAIKKQIIRRDEEDMSRPFGRLVRADDAFYIDTSSMEMEDVVQSMVDIVRNSTAKTRKN